MSKTYTASDQVRDLTYRVRDLRAALEAKEARCETFKQMSQLSQREHSKTTVLLHTLYEEVAIHCVKAFAAGFAAGALLLWAMT